MPNYVMKLKIMCWNVNTRLLHCINYAQFLTDFDFIFVEEVGLPDNKLPNLNDFVPISDPEVKFRQHGGVAVYVRENMKANIFDLKFKETFISFQHKSFKNSVFMGVYMPHSESKFFKPELFAELSTHIEHYSANNFSIYAGGDYNSRVKDLNNLIIGTFFHSELHFEVNS